ncbi:MAG: hypothetical protein ACYCPO_12355 [Acidobacteriaceae bacterium]
MGDLNALTGENGLRLGPQSEIHAKFGDGERFPSSIFSIHRNKGE